MKRHLMFFITVLFTMALLVNNMYAQTTLYSETFTNANGTTVGSGAPASWTRDLNGRTPTIFQVQSNVFEAENTGGEVIWNSQLIYIQDWQYVNISVDMPINIDNMEADDYINFYYKLNGGTETVFSVNGINTGNFSGGRVSSQSGLKGNTLQIVARIKNNASNEDHFFDNVTVTGYQYAYFEDFNSYTNGTTTSSQWSVNNPGTVKTFSVQNGEFQYRNSAQTAIWQTSVINISEFSSVNLQVMLRENSDSKLEASDWIEVLYVLDGGAETRFQTNGYFADDFPSPYVFNATHNNLTGSTIQIIVKAKTNADDEYYYWDDVIITGTKTPSSLSLSSSKTNVICYGTATGSVNITNITGGRAPFIYSWSNGTTTQNAANVAIGTYTVTVTDNIGQTATASHTLTQPVAYDFAKTLSNYNGVNVSCNGGSNGSVDLTVNAGNTSPYTFLWSTGATTEDISGRTAGTYTVTVTDVNGCTGTTNATLTQPSAVSGSIVKTNISCLSVTDGTATLTPSGGISPYTYSWTGGATTQNRTGLATGSYTVTITDVNSCTGTASTTLTNPAAMSVSVTSSTNILCNGASTGAVNITAAGGTVPLTYLWSHGATTEDLTNVPATTYTVTVTANGNSGCTVTTSATLTQPSAITVTETVTNVSCNGFSDGAITISASGGTGTKTYLWAGGSTAATRSNLVAGSYPYTVTDANSCTKTNTINITQPTLISVSINKTLPTSNYNNNGSMDMTVSGGVPPYTYAWSNTKTTQDIDSIQSGSYTWLVTDSTGCTKTNMEYLVYNDTIKKGSFIINMGVTPQTIANGLKPYGLIYQLVRNYKVPVIWSIDPYKAKDGKDFTYNGVDYKGGTFIVDEGFITNAVKDLITTWQGKGVVGVYTTSPLIAPVYQHVTGFANLVVDQDNENLVIPYFNNAEVPSSIYTVGLPSSLGACHDFFMLPHADPTWALHGNLYTFNRTRKGHIWTGCHATSMLEGVKNPSNNTQQMNFLSKTGLQCYKSGNCGGISEVHASAHTDPMTYDAAYNSHPIMQFLGDMTGATLNGSERWYIPVSTGGWNDNVARALKTSDGSAGKEGIKLAFGYGFNNPLHGIVMYEGGHTAHNNGTVPERVAAQRAFFNFILHASIEKTITGRGSVPNTFINMEGQTVSVNVTGGNPPYTYLWTSTAPGTFGNATAATTTFIPTGGQADRSYFITCQVQDACGRITVLSAPIEFLDIEGTTTDVSCYGGSNGTINITIIGGTPPFTYEWSNGATTEDLTNIPAGDYEVVVTDAGGYSQNAFFTVEEPTELAITDSVTPTTYACSNDGAITLNASGATPPYTYQWSTGATTANVSGLSKTTYTVTITDSRSCQKSFPITVPGPNALAINFSPVNVNTYDAANGSINATPTGGTSPYTYVWCNGNTTYNIINQKAGPYSLTVTDVGGCTVSGSSVIGVNNAITFKGLQFGETSELTWNSSSNWDGGQIPATSNNVVIPAGCAATVTVPVNINTKDLFIAEGAQVVITNGNDLQINGDFIVNGSFVAGTGNVRFGGSIQQRIITNQTVAFYKLTMQNTSPTGLLPDTNIIIQNQLTLNDGHIFTGEDDSVIVINAASDAVVNHTSASYIVGHLCRHIINTGTVTYDYPLGYGQPTEYFKATVISKALKTTSKITGTVIPMERSVLHFDPEETFSVSDEAMVYVYVQPEAMWILEPDVQPTGGQYDIRLYTENIPDIADNYFGVIKRISGGVDSNWVANFGTSSTFGGEGRLKEHGYALKKGAASFSEFGVGTGRSNPLPIELVMFDAKIKDDGKTHLEWYTATEINNDYFTIERIKDMNGAPEEVAKVKGAGNSSVLNHYAAIDPNPHNGISYYRLKQTDTDGKFSYSNWIAVENKTKTNFTFSIRPNPADHYADIDFSNVKGDLTLVIFDANSNVVYSKSFSEKSQPGTHRIVFSDILSKGVYFIQVYINNEVHLQRLIVQ